MKIYLFRGLMRGTYTIRVSPRTYEDREALIRRNVKWETSGTERGVDLPESEINKEVSQHSSTGNSSFADTNAQVEYMM